MSHTLIEIKNLSIALPKGLDREFAVRDVSLTVDRNEIVCVVGESGSGKSVTAQMLMGLLPPTLPLVNGTASFKGVNLATLTEKERRALRGDRMSLIFQEPLSALNPVMTVGEQIAEVFRYHRDETPDVRKKVVELLAAVRLPNPEAAYDSYPFRMSGGQRQRVVIAIALALQPDLLIADEPTTALDVTTQAQILELIRTLQRERQMGVMFITHDFGVVADIADKVVVMRHGEIVERGAASEVLGNPQHEYTRALIAAVPRRREHSLSEVARGEPPVLRVRGMRKVYRTGGGLLKRASEVVAVNDMDLDLQPGETLGIVGESGSGKSTAGRCIMRLIEPDAGRIEIAGQDTSGLGVHAMKPHRHLVQMVFQDPYASLNPRRQVGEILCSGMINHGMAQADAERRARELLELVGLTTSAFNRYPHEFSGGQRQRIGIARALALKPRLLIADEPVSALDVSIQAQILTLLRELREQFGLSMVFITHDLRVASQICDRIAVMQRGVVVEQGATEDIFDSPQHPYTQTLIAAMPGRLSPLAVI